MRYRVLGAVAAADESESVALGGPRARAVLALLLVDAGKVVTDRRLIDGIWHDDAPQDAQHAIQNHVSRLRRAIDDEIVREGGGYRLAVDPLAVDAHRFATLVASGRARLVDAPAAAAMLLRDALALWHGEPYADLGDVPGLQPEIRRLAGARLAAVEDRVQADIDTEAHSEVVAELEALLREHPFRERLYGMQMLALYRSGRQAEALDAFQRARRVLADELGVDPSPELVALHGRILAQDPSLQHARGRPAPVGVDDAGQVDGSLPVIRGFELREHVGDGDFGRTYRAYHASLGREVALKVLHDELSDLPDLVRGFDRRAQRIAQLDHPHVVPLLDSWRDPGAVYLVTPWVPGGSVRDALRHGPWTPTAALRMLEQVGTALELAHRRGVVHGDVKTSNILLSGDGSARLTDFAVAPRRRDALGVAQTNDLGAIAPEQRRGAPPSTVGDVYAYGAVAIAALTADRIAHERPAGALEQRDDVPTEVVGALASATATDAAQRPERIADVLRLLRRGLGADVVAPAAVPEDDAVLRNPYKGLHAFGEDDAVDFYGRAAVVERMVQAISEHPLVAVVGPSGSGKSSIVRAGAIPALRSGVLPGSERWLIADLYPGSHPFDELAVALQRVAVDPPHDLVAALTADERGLARLVKQILPGDDAQLLLVIDQFEELFSLTRDATTRQLFLDSLVAVAEDARGRIRTVVTLRADFFDRPLEHHVFGELVRTGLVSVTVPSHDELAQAVSAPARNVGAEFEPGLIGRIVGDVADQPGGLPLLQYALTELFARRSGRTLSAQAYGESGGVRGALARRAEELYAALPSAQQRLARQVFLRLVSVDEHAGETRRRAHRTELVGLSNDRAGVDDVLQRFGAHRLLTYDHDQVTRGATVEVAHEALLSEWGRLRRWIDDRRDDLLLRRRLAADTAAWGEAERAPEFLLTGGRLEQASGFVASTDLALDSSERDFVAASLEQADVVRRARRRQRLIVAGALLGVALLTVALVGLGLLQRERDTTRGQIEHAATLAAASRSAQTTDADLAVLLASEAVDTLGAAEQTPTSEALGALHEAVLNHRVVRSFTTNSYAVRYIDDGRLIAPSGDGGAPTIWNAESGAVERTLEQGFGGAADFAVSADGRRYAEVDGRDPITIWDLESGRVLRLIPAGGLVQDWPAFDPTGELLAVVNTVRSPTNRDTISVYDVATGREQHVIALTGKVWRAVVSPDGRTLAVGSQDEATVRLFDLATGDQRDAIRGPAGTEGAVGIAFHPDGHRMAVLYTPGEVVIHDLASGEAVTRVASSGDPWDVCYGGDGRTLAVTKPSDAVDVHDADTGAALVTLPSVELFSAATCSADGTRVAAGSVTSRARVWDITGAGASEVWSAVAPAPWTVAWAGDQLVTTHADRRLRRHDPGAGTTITSDVALAVTSTLPLAHAPERGHLATSIRPLDGAGDDGLVLRDVDDLEVVRRFPRNLEPLAFSADGAQLLASDFEAVYALDVATGATIRTFTTPEPGITTLRGAFLADGDHVAADMLSHTWLFERDTGDVAATVCANGLGANVVASPDGELLAVDGSSGVEVYDLPWLLTLAGDAPRSCDDDGGSNPSDDARVALLEGGAIRFMDFSPDGTRLATASESGAVSVWDPRSGDVLVTIRHDGEVGGAAFSDDGNHLAVTVDDPAGDRFDAVRVYTLDVDELLEIADAKVTRQLTAEECAGYRIEAPCGGAAK